MNKQVTSQKSNLKGVSLLRSIVTAAFHDHGTRIDKPAERDSFLTSENQSLKEQNIRHFSRDEISPSNLILLSTKIHTLLSE